MKKSEIGRLGEDAVCRYLIEKGYNIAVRNYRIKGGEIDIIAENEDFVAFVEVKTRKPDSLVGGFEAVDDKKRRLIIRTAADYCSRNVTVLQPRFDVAQVILDGDRICSIDYIKNAFDTTGCKFIF